MIHGIINFVRRKIAFPLLLFSVFLLLIGCQRPDEEIVVEYWTHADDKRKELETGLLHAGPRHTDDFWKENVRAFELEDFKLIKKLIECLGSEDVDTVCIACHDLSAFACYYPNGRK